MDKLKRISLVLLIAGYLVAGANHFIHPDFYLQIIPHDIPFPVTVNLLAGLAEILLALLLIFPKTRAIAAWGIILMLAAFLPVHINMMMNAPTKAGSLIVSPILAVSRLFLQPVLMLWAWWHTKKW